MFDLLKVRASIIIAVLFAALALGIACGSDEEPAPGGDSGSSAAPTTAPPTATATAPASQPIPTEPLPTATPEPMATATAPASQPPATEPPPTAAPEPTATAVAPAVVRGDPGIYDDRVVFGQSAAFTGPAAELGLGMRLGIEAAFNEANRHGGVHGRTLEMETLDDFYEPDSAFGNTMQLIEAKRVFALIGEVGTPTSRAALPAAEFSEVPFLAPFTGAQFLRDPELSQVLNLRASYYQETEEMVARLTEDLDITKVAILYQNDSYGEAGLEGARLALRNRGLEPVAAAYYQRNTSAVKTALLSIVPSDPEALIMIGAYSPVARAIELAREDISPVFMAVSFVGSNALAAELGPEGAGVYVTQVVPLPGDANIPVVAAYQAALAEYDSGAVPGFVSLEGYLAGRLAIAALEECGPELSRQCFMDAVYDTGQFDINGFQLQFSDGDNQGSDAVFLTVLGEDGKYRHVDEIGGTR